LLKLLVGEVFQKKYHSLFSSHLKH
jgi:hypothetical protein